MYFNGNSGARSDRFSIQDSTFFDMPIATPCIKEQELISEVLEETDNLITLHQREPPHMMKEDKNANQHQRRISFS